MKTRRIWLTFIILSSIILIKLLIYNDTSFIVTSWILILLLCIKLYHEHEYDEGTNFEHYKDYKR